MREVFQQGDRLGEYEILGRLRAGGMATLFLGRRHGAAGISRPVAIKVVHPHLAEEELLIRMFIDEARISSHISHSNVVYVEKFGEHEGVYYIVMEYVDGCSLEQLLKTLSMRGEQIPPEVAVYIAMETASGLHAAHETADEAGVPLGIVHRDVSPSNVLLTRDGRVKVIDFGIAKARGRLVATNTGAKLKGKLRYMSPEQAWGRAIDRRTDVYALGVVLWELLAVRVLFRAEDELAVLELVRNPTIPPPSQHNADVTLALDAVVARATAKEAAHRLPTALELRRELMQAVPGAVTVPAEALAQLVARVRQTLGVAEIEDRKRTTPASPSALSDSYPTQLSPASISEASVPGAAGEVQPRARRRSRWTVAVGGAAAAGALAVAIAIAVGVGGGSGSGDSGGGGGGGGSTSVPGVPAATAPPVATPAPTATAPAPTATVPAPTATAPAPTATVPAPTATAPVVTTPPTAAPAVTTPPTAAPAVTTAPPPAASAAAATTAPPPATAAAPTPRPAAPPRGPVRPAGPSSPAPAAAVKAVDVDGALLADEPANKPAARPATRPPKQAAPQKQPAPQKAVQVDGTVLAK